MTTATLHDVTKPTDQILAKATAEVKVKDAQGRTFTLRKPGFLAQFDLVEVCGASADIDRYFSMVLPVIYIVAIDNEPIVQPSNKTQLRGLVTRIGEDAFNVITRAINENYAPKNADETKKNLEV